MKKLFILGFLFLGFFMNSFSQSRDQVYAGVIFHIIKYVEWPSYPKDYINVGVVEDVRLTKMLNNVFKGKKIHFKDLKALDCSQFNNISSYHVLFFSGRNSSKISQITKNIIENNILTISEVTQLTSSSTIFNIIENKGKLEVELYLKNLNKMDFKVSEQLKKIANIR